MSKWKKEEDNTERENNTLYRYFRKTGERKKHVNDTTQNKRKNTGKCERRERNRNDTKAKFPDWKATPAENPLIKKVMEGVRLTKLISIVWPDASLSICF